MNIKPHFMDVVVEPAPKVIADVVGGGNSTWGAVILIAIGLLLTAAVVTILVLAVRHTDKQEKHAVAAALEAEKEQEEK